MHNKKGTCLAITLVFSGIVMIVGSLATAYLDSLGYWNFPKDFTEAIFRNIRNEAFGFGIDGLQIFHYLIGGIVSLFLGGLILRGIFKSERTSKTLIAELPKNVDVLSAKISSLECETENLRLQLSKYEKKPSMAFQYIILVIGALSLISSVLISYSILAFVGLGLLLWGALLMYVRPTEYVRVDLLTSTVIPLLTMINNDLVRSGEKGKAVYLPPTHLKEMKGGTIFLESGLNLPPPGQELVNLYEEKLKANFAQEDLDYLQMNLPTLFTEILEIARSMKMKVEGNIVKVRIEGSIYGNLCKQIRETFPAICNIIGCPLISSIALSIARASANRVIIEENKISEDGQTIDVDFRISRDETKETIEATKVIETPRPRLSILQRTTHVLTNGLFLLVAGACVVAFTLYIVWYDISVWGKDLVTILFDSRTGELISLGIGMKLGYYLLISLLLLIVGIARYIFQRSR